MTFIRRVVGTLNFVHLQTQLIHQQRALIANLMADRDRTELAHVRDLQGLVSGWLIHIEQPEMDVRDSLVEFETDLFRRIAVLEEHIL